MGRNRPDPTLCDPPRWVALMSYVSTMTMGVRRSGMAPADPMLFGTEEKLRTMTPIRSSAAPELAPARLLPKKASAFPLASFFRFASLFVSANPYISSRIRNLRCSWRNSLVDRSKKHSGSYGLRGIDRNVKPDAVQNRIGQTVKPEILKNILTLLMIQKIYHFTVRLGEMFGLSSGKAG